MAFPLDDPPEKLQGLFWGEVLERVDPEGLGRVRLEIPGKVSRSLWAWPVGMPGAGGAQRGAFVVPPIGATVLVGFIAGDVDEPVYFGGPFGMPSADETNLPTDVQDHAVEETPQIASFETTTWSVTLLDIPAPEGAAATEGDRRFRIINKRTGDYFEMDDRDNSMTLSATTGLNIMATGVIDIRSDTRVQIQGRTVIPSGDRIS